MRRISLIAMAALLLVAPAALAACGGGTAESGVTTAATSPTSLAPGTTAAPGNSEGQVFSLQLLAEFDGNEGRAAYIAVDGVVYDVSGSNRWPEGRHSGCDLGAMAGRDLSEEITKAPSGMRALVQRLPVVGRLE